MARYSKRTFFGGETHTEVSVEREALLISEGPAKKPEKRKTQRREVADPFVREVHYLDACRKLERGGWSRVDPIATTPVLERPELETAARESPQARLVFCDALQSAADPWGELMALSLARGASTVTTRELDLQRGLLGRFVADPSAFERGQGHVEWRDGFPNRLRVFDDPDEPTLAMLKSARLMQHVDAIHLGIDTRPAQASGADANSEALVKWLLSVTGLRVSELFLGDSDQQLSWTELPPVGRLAELPTLRSLRVRGGNGTLEGLNLPRLASFSIETGGLRQEALMHIATASWPELHSLEVWFGDPNYGLTCGPAEVEAFLSKLEAPKLAQLALRNCAFAHEVIPLLTRWPGLKHLKALDLSMGGLQPGDVPMLLSHAPSFAHLERFDLSDNMLATERALLRSVALPPSHLGLDALGAILVGEQRHHAEMDGERYASVGE